MNQELVLFRGIYIFALSASQVCSQKVNFETTFLSASDVRLLMLTLLTCRYLIKQCIRELAKLKIHSDEYLSFVVVDCNLQCKGLAMFCVLFCLAPDIV